MTGGGDRWSVLVPVKRLDRAKTRLDVPAPARADIALAMAIDTVRAVAVADAVAEVVVITDDPRAAAALGAIGARVVADVPDAGLNPALRHGASVAISPRIAALSSDLPALRSPDLDAVLTESTRHQQAAVSDLSGTGTTLLAATRAARFSPAFGENSFREHLRAGAEDISEVAAVSVRHDVDTLEALRSAVALGVGPETARAVSALGPGFDAS
jgi:2-phospho-L-lactate guanylyltransferase